MEIKGSARENLLEDKEFSLIKNLNEKVSEKKKAKDQDHETTEDLFCKLLAADLKMLPVYERFIARNEIRGVMFKLQMSVLKKQQIQTNPPNQTYFNQNVPFHTCLHKPLSLELGRDLALCHHQRQLVLGERHCNRTLSFRC